MLDTTNIFIFRKNSYWKSLALFLGGLLLLFMAIRSCPSQGVRLTADHNLVAPTPSPGDNTGPGGITIIALSQAPKYAQKMIAFLKKAKNLKPPPDFKGGRVFRNREGNLPGGKTYYEFDVHPYISGVSRGAERLVVDQQKTVFYYSKDHYKTFVQIK